MASTEKQELGPEQLEEEFSVIFTPMSCCDDPSSFAIHRLVLSTQTSNNVPNFLTLADVVLPIGATESGVGKSENSVIPKVEITQKIRVDGEVNQARCMLQNSTVIGIKTNDCNKYNYFGY